MTHEWRRQPVGTRARAHEAMPEKDNAETRSPQRFRRADGWESGKPTPTPAFSCNECGRPIKIVLVAHVCATHFFPSLGRLIATKSTRPKGQTLSSNQFCAKVNRLELQILKDLEWRCGGRSFSLCRQNLVLEPVHEALERAL